MQQGAVAQHTAGNLQLYEILYNLNQGFEQVLDQLRQLEKLILGTRRGRPSA
jgi:hypothetical protein